MCSREIYTLIYMFMFALNFNNHIFLKVVCNLIITFKNPSYGNCNLIVGFDQVIVI